MRRLLVLILLLAGLALPAVAWAETPPETYVDADGTQRDFDGTYRGWFGPDRYQPDWPRAVTENVVLLGLELFIYWYAPDQNSVDWQFPDLSSKFTTNQVISFDDNLTKTNWLAHPLAGAAHYAFTRSNGISVLPSFAAAAASSAIYEAVLEWREIVSVNDLIVTPFAGMAFGEFLYQLGNYLNSEQVRPRRLEQVTGSGALGRGLAARSLGFVRRMHNKLDDPVQPPLVSDDNLGLSSAYHHRFHVVGGLDALRNGQGREGSVLVAGFGADLVAMPGFLRPGHFDTWYTGGNFTRFDLRLGFNDELRDVEVMADAHLFGHYHQDLRAGRGGLSGHAREIGARTALRYADRKPFGRRDQYGVLHVMGPAATVWLRGGPLQYRLSADVSPDFAAFRSLAFPRWAAENGGPAGTKSSLVRHGYQNTWGASAGARASATLGTVTLDVEGRYGRYETIDGLERRQDEVTREPHGSEDLLELRSALRIEPRRNVAFGALTAARIARQSTLGETSVERLEDRLGIAVGVRF